MRPHTKLTHASTAHHVADGIKRRRPEWPNALGLARKEDEGVKGRRSGGKRSTRLLRRSGASVLPLRSLKHCALEA